MQDEQHVQGAFKDGVRPVALLAGFVHLVEEGAGVAEAGGRGDEGATLANSVGHTS